MPVNNVGSLEAECQLRGMTSGVDIDDIPYKNAPAVIALRFSYLFTTGRDYYSLYSPGENDQKTEEEGGIAVANKAGYTLS